MAVRQLVGLVFIAVVAAGCGHASVSPYRIEQDESGVRVLHQDDGAFRAEAGTCVMMDGATVKLSSTDQDQSMRPVACCDVCSILPDGTFLGSQCHDGGC